MRTSEPFKAPGASPSARGSLLINAYLAYYWALLYVTGIAGGEIERGSYVYWALLVPAVGLAGLGALNALFDGFESNPFVQLLWGWVFLVTSISLARLDLPTAYHAALVFIPMALFARYRVAPSLWFVNALFACSFGVALVLYRMGLSEFSLLPGQTAFLAAEGFDWRISLFPLIPESAFFALVVILWNQLCGKGKARFAFIGLGLYILVFSGLRSALIAFLMAEACVAALHVRFFRRAWLPEGLFVCMIATFVLIVSAPHILATLTPIESESLNRYIFRADQVWQSEQEATKGAYRGWLWAKHLEIMLENPVLGVGTFDILDHIDVGDPVASGTDTGWESFITAWLARAGLSGLLIPLVVLIAIRNAVRTGNLLGYCLGIVVTVTMLAYGSFLITYNFLYLLLVSLWAGSIGSPPLSRSCLSDAQTEAPAASAPLDSSGPHQ